MFRSNYRDGILLKLDSQEVSTEGLGLWSCDQLSLPLFCFVSTLQMFIRCRYWSQESKISHTQPALLVLRILRTTQARNIHSLLAFAFTEPFIPGFFLEKGRAIQTLHLACLINRSVPARRFREANPENILRPETAFPVGDFNYSEHFMEQLPANAPPIHP